MSLKRLEGLEKINKGQSKINLNKKEKVRRKVETKKVQTTIEAKAKSRMLKRDALQVRINKRLRDLASKLEREKIIEEKKMTQRI